MSERGAIRDFTDLLVWQKAIQFGRLVYHLSSLFPNDERFGLTAQVRRAAVSVASDIAEGHARQGREFRYYLSVARNSNAEVESQLLFAAELGYLPRADISPVRDLAGELHRMMAALTRSVRDK